MKNLVKSFLPAAVVAANMSAATPADAQEIVYGSEQQNGAVCYNWPNLRVTETEAGPSLTAGGTTRICFDAAGQMTAPLDPAVILSTNVLCEVYKYDNPAVAAPTVCPPLMSATPGTP